MASTVVKKLGVQDDRTPCDSDVEKHSTDAYRDEMEKQNDPRMKYNERESTDDHKIDRRRDDQSFTTQVFHNIFVQKYYLTLFNHFNYLFQWPCQFRTGMVWVCSENVILFGTPNVLSGFLP